MKILEFMSFNPEWFLTVPGVLITGGVILLIIALIILISSGNKSEDDIVPPPIGPIEITPETNNGVLNNQNNEPTVQSEYQATTPVQEISQEPVINNAPTYTEPSTIPVSNPEPVGVPSFSQPEPTPVEQAIPNNSPVYTQFVENPNLNVSQEQPAPIQQEVEYNSPAPVIPETMNVQPEPEIQPMEQNIAEVGNTEPNIPPVSIYGGVSPSVNIFEQPQVKPIIYGGADPLENTSPIPKVEQHVNEIPETVMPEPVVENVVQEAPSVEPVAPIIDNQVEPEPKQPEVILQEEPTPNIIKNENDIETLDF